MAVTLCVSHPTPDTHPYTEVSSAGRTLYRTTLNSLLKLTRTHIDGLSLEQSDFESLVKRVDDAVSRNAQKTITPTQYEQELKDVWTKLCHHLRKLEQSKRLFKCLELIEKQITARHEGPTIAQLNSRCAHPIKLWHEMAQFLTDERKVLDELKLHFSAFTTKKESTLKTLVSRLPTPIQSTLDPCATEMPDLDQLNQFSKELETAVTTACNNVLLYLESTLQNLPLFFGWIQSQNRAKEASLPQHVETVDKEYKKSCELLLSAILLQRLTLDIQNCIGVPNLASTELSNSKVITEKTSALYEKIRALSQANADSQKRYQALANKLDLLISLLRDDLFDHANDVCTLLKLEYTKGELAPSLPDDKREGPWVVVQSDTTPSSAQQV